jgi:hypothetical protein
MVGKLEMSRFYDFYVNLRVEVGKHPQVILAMYFYLGQE